jgi:hypothetical protein
VQTKRNKTSQTNKPNKQTKQTNQPIETKQESNYRTPRIAYCSNLGCSVVLDFNVSLSSTNSTNVGIAVVSSGVVVSHIVCIY